MPSFEHGTLVEMFRDDPELAARLLDRAFHIPVPPHRSTKVAEADLGKLVPIEFEADLVIELNDERGECVMAIVLEIQLGIDPDKKFSWPVYVAVLRARKRCPVCLLVVAPDPPVGTWAAQPISLGPSTGQVTPFVLGASVVPRVVDADEARREPALAVLSARVHGNGPGGLDVIQPAVAAMRSVDPALATKYFMLVYDALRGPMRAALEDLVMNQSHVERMKLPPFLEKIAREREVQIEIKAILKLVARNSLELTDDERARITSCTDLTTLDHWFDNAFTAKTAAELFA
ncbi:MAG: hypothetical protein ACMG6S_35360 [Byssovorax sp.]